MKKLIAGNWKMNGTLESASQLFEDIATGLEQNPQILDKCDMLVCPAFVHLPIVKRTRNDDGAQILIGAQTCSFQDEGAYTGEISATMLEDLGCEYVIIGHSERRQYHKESSVDIGRKVEKAHEHGLVTIICVGEKEDEREEGGAKDVVEEQLHQSMPPGSTSQNTVIAYEPVWAIGTGRTATPEDVEDMHAFIREKLKEKLEDSEKVRILYGGSVKPENAASLLNIKNVDGALIGGASLEADSFLGIAKAV
jgi:triosephosphate isomerase